MYTIAHNYLKGAPTVVTKSRNAEDKKKGTVKVGSLKVNKETVKDLTDVERKKIKGGALRRYPTSLVLTCGSTCDCP